MLEDDSESDSRRVSTLRGSIQGPEDFLEAEQNMDMLLKRDSIRQRNYTVSVAKQ